MSALEVRELVRSEIRHSEIKVERNRASAWVAAIAAMALILGFIQWHVTGLRNDTRTEFGSIRAEIQNVRTDMRAEISALRGEVSSLGERMARVEALLVDRLPAAP